MTKEEILSMKPGRELDALVGEYVFGYKRELTPPDYHGKHGGEPLLVPPDLPERFEYPPSGKIAFWYHCEKWSTELSAAWELRQYIHETIGGTRIVSVCDDYPELCKIWNGKTYIEARGRTVPEAICKAALIAKIGGSKPC